MDSDDIGYNTVGWDTYSPANPHEDSRLSSGAENRLHRSHLHASGFEGSDDDDDDIPSLSAAASTAILPAETSAWADEPLDNEVIDINGTGVNISSSPHNNNSFASNMFSQDNPNSDDDDPPERQPSQQPYSSRAAGKAVKRDEDPSQYESSLYEQSKATTVEDLLAGMYSMEVTVTDPVKEEDSYISYQVNTKTNMKGFTAPNVSVRRRYQDFRWLYNALNRDYPERVLPPLPDKHRLGYVRGDRFSKEFVEKRRASLERFLKKIASHPVLQTKKQVRAFLDSRDWSSEQAQQSRLLPDESRLDTVGDALLNAFSKIKKPEERFIIIKDEVDKLEENLLQLERIEQRALRRQEELEVDYREFGGAITSLGNLETGITGPLHRFGHTVSGFANILRELTAREEAEFLSELHECLAYCNSVKNVLKLRDQKQLDFEVLSDLRQQAESERERLLSNGRLGGSSGLGGFFQQKFDELKGVNQEQAKAEKIKVVEGKIDALGDETNKSLDISQAFSNEASKEYEIFQLQKTRDLRQCLLDYCSGRLDFFEKGEELWSQIIPDLEAIQVDI